MHNLGIYFLWTILFDTVIVVYLQYAVNTKSLSSTGASPAQGEVGKIYDFGRGIKSQSLSHIA